MHVNTLQNIRLQRECDDVFKHREDHAFEDIACHWNEVRRFVRAHMPEHPEGERGSIVPARNAMSVCSGLAIS